MGMYGGSGGMGGGMGGAMPGSFRGGMIGGQMAGAPTGQAQMPFTGYSNLSPAGAGNMMYMGPQSDTGFDGQPWQNIQGNMVGGGQGMPARMPAGVNDAYANQFQNAIYRAQGNMAAQGNPDAYATLQAKVAQNHPGWNQNRVNNRAAFRLGKRGV